MKKRQGFDHWDRFLILQLLAFLTCSAVGFVALGLSHRFVLTAKHVVELQVGFGVGVANTLFHFAMAYILFPYGGLSEGVAGKARALFFLYLAKLVILSLVVFGFLHASFDLDLIWLSFGFTLQVLTSPLGFWIASNVKRLPL